MRTLMVELREMGVPMTHDIVVGVSEYVLMKQEKGMEIDEIEARTVAQWLDQNTDYEITSRVKVESDALVDSPY